MNHTERFIEDTICFIESPRYTTDEKLRYLVRRGIMAQEIINNKEVKNEFN